MSFDLVILRDWEKTASEEDWAHEEGIAKDAVDRPSGPYEAWEMLVVHPIEQRNYGVDLKFLGSHWRMRVYYKSIRDGLRFVKALFPSGEDETVEEAQFIALKYLHRYFQEQLAMYNAVCILHLGNKYTEICDCDDKDHSQHLEHAFKPLMPYDGQYFRRWKAKLPARGNKLMLRAGSKTADRMVKDGIADKELCEWCVGDIDLEAYIKYGLCPVCRAHIPHPDDVLYGTNYDASDEFLKWRKEQYERLAEENKKGKKETDL